MGSTDEHRVQDTHNAHLATPRDHDSTDVTRSTGGVRSTPRCPDIVNTY